MKASYILGSALALLAFTTSSFAKIESTSVNGNLVTRYIATTGETFRIETTEPTSGQTYEFKTTINGSWDQYGEYDLDNLLGTVEHDVISEKRGDDGSVRYATKNVHYDALGNYTKTTYSIIVLDNAGVLVNVIWGDTLGEILETGTYHNRSNLKYRSVTVGLEPQ